MLFKHKKAAYKCHHKDCQQEEMQNTQQQQQLPPREGHPSISPFSSRHSCSISSALHFSCSSSVIQAPRSCTAGTCRTMEEVWKEISLGDAPHRTTCMDHHRHLPHSSAGPPFAAHCHMYQCTLPPPPESLSVGVKRPRPGSTASLGPPTPLSHQVSAVALATYLANNKVIHLKTTSSVPGRLAPPITAGLSLNSSLDLNIFCHDDQSRPAAPLAAVTRHPEPSAVNRMSNHRSPAMVTSTFPTPLPFTDAIRSRANGSIFPFIGGNKKRPAAAERQHQLLGADCARDNSQKRRIKNRESAARSRARKQAYTNELEAEVAHLTVENSKLRRQNENMQLAMAAQFLVNRKALQRSSTAPF